MISLASWFGLPLSYDAAVLLLCFQFLFVVFGIPIWMYARYRSRSPETRALPSAGTTILLSWAILVGYSYAMRPFFEAHALKCYLDAVRPDKFHYLEELESLPERGKGMMLYLYTTSAFGWAPAVLCIAMVEIAHRTLRLFRRIAARFQADQNAG